MKTELPLNTRRLAAIIAASGDDGRRFSREFMRTALTSQPPRLIQVVIAHYVLGHNDVHHYFDELAIAMDALPDDLRLQIALMPKIACHDPIPVESQSAFQRLMERISRDNNEQIRLLEPKLKAIPFKRAQTKRGEEH